MDNIILTNSESSALQNLIHTLSFDFLLKDLDRLHYVLSFKVYHLPTGLLFFQKKYILDLLKKTNMSITKPIQTPMFTFDQLTAHKGAAFEDSILYRSVVSSLQYLAFTRTDHLLLSTMSVSIYASSSGFLIGKF